jgi:hypothetical protein
MPPKLRKLFALRYLGGAASKDFSADVVDWAISELVDGNITDSLSILAGLTPPVHWQELDYYFQRTLDESGWTAPPEDECLRLYARDIAGELTSGAVAPLKGCDRIYEITEQLGYPDDMSTWLYLHERLEPVSYEELQGAALEQAIREEALRFAGTP